MYCVRKSMVDDGCLCRKSPIPWRNVVSTIAPGRDPTTPVLSQTEERNNHKAYSLSGREGSLFTLSPMKDQHHAKHQTNSEIVNSSIIATNKLQSPLIPQTRKKIYDRKPTLFPAAKIPSPTDGRGAKYPQSTPPRSHSQPSQPAGSPKSASAATSDSDSVPPNGTTISCSRHESYGARCQSRCVVFCVLCCIQLRG